MNEERLEEIRLRSYRFRYDVLCLIGEVARLEQRNHLESAVVEAVVARRAALKLATTHAAYQNYYAAVDAEVAAINALIAFRKEKGEVDA